MENQKYSKTNAPLSGADPSEKVKEAISNIKNIVSENSWCITKGAFDEVNLKGLSNKINDLSFNQRKKLRNYLIHLDRHVTIKRINLFFHFLFKHVVKTDYRVKVEVSEKEAVIQAARKKWKEADAIAQTLLKTYKEEKGDFYKNQLVVSKEASKDKTVAKDNAVKV